MRVWIRLRLSICLPVEGSSRVRSLGRKRPQLVSSPAPEGVLEYREHPRRVRTTLSFKLSHVEGEVFRHAVSGTRQSG